MQARCWQQLVAHEQVQVQQQLLLQVQVLQRPLS
jgi:hypothetical protein